MAEISTKIMLVVPINLVSTKKSDEFGGEGCTNINLTGDSPIAATGINIVSSLEPINTTSDINMQLVIYQNALLSILQRGTFRNLIHLEHTIVYVHGLALNFLVNRTQSKRNSINWLFHQA